MKNVIPVVFCFDKRIILAASVAIKSLIDCAKDSTTYDIRIFHSDLSLKNQKNISKLTENTRHNITFHYIDSKLFKDAPHNNHSWTEIVYYRLLIPEILIKYDKTIYSDVDVLFKDDLSELYNTDLDGYELGSIHTYLTDYLKQTNSKRYFPENKNKYNYISGLLLFNNKLMREEKTVNKFFNTIKTYKDRLTYFDMDCMNLTCTRIKDLPLEYCVLENFYENTDITTVPEYKSFITGYSYQELIKAKENAKIIHYAGKLGKPWARKWVPEYYQEYIYKLPKELVKYTFRDYRKKYLSKQKFPQQHFDVGISNFYHSQNYGACLTAYALQEIIKSLGLSCAFVNEFDVREKYRLSFGTLFVNRHLKRMIRFNSYKKAGACANTYISGSDQVFRPHNIKKKKQRDLFLLNFVPSNKKKIAFSASFGINAEEFKQESKYINKHIKTALRKFDYISCRENDGVDICTNQLGVNAEWIIDPVFLANKNIFEKLADKSNKTFKNEIVTYILDKKPEYAETLKTISSKYNMEIVEIKLKNSVFSVEDWVRAFIDAKYIVTDSYHGICFALIFNKPFIAINNKKRGSSRFKALDNKFKIADCLCEANEFGKHTDFKSLDYSKINTLINEETKKNTEILKRKLSINKK